MAAQQATPGQKETTRQPTEAVSYNSDLHTLIRLLDTRAPLHNS
jgi:hypothetical protein